MSTVSALPARLRWNGRAMLPAQLEQELMGPGAPFEMVPEQVLGHEMLVFAQRPRSLRAMYDQATAPHGSLPFLVTDDRVWTFAECTAAIDAVAAQLRERYGIGKGDRVAIVAANSPEYGIAIWATLSIGAVVASLNGWWTSAELEHGIALSSPSVILGDERRLARVRECRNVDVPIHALSELVAEARDVSGVTSPEIAVDEDDPAVILFTSGTTGRAKGATLSHRNIVNFAIGGRLNVAIGQALRPTPAGRARQPASILSGPMFHVSGLVAITMTGPSYGTKLVFAPQGRWDPTTHLRLTAEHGVSSWSGVPTQLWKLIGHPDLEAFDLSSLRAVSSGGAPFPPELVHEFTERLPSVTLSNGYGMSETTGTGTLCSGPMMLRHPGSVGGAQVGCEVEIRDERGNVLVEDEIGEIHLRTACVFLGYWQNDEATEACLDAERWYRTGDFGRISGGVLYVESRMRDLILRGGENIYPIEIEHRLVEHPDIDDAAVVGVDHHELGQEVKAVVVVRTGSDLSTDDVQAWVAETLAPYKVPAYVEFRAALPYTETGKVLKHELER